MRNLFLLLYNLIQSPTALTAFNILSLSLLLRNLLMMCFDDFYSYFFSCLGILGACIGFLASFTFELIIFIKYKHLQPLFSQTLCLFPTFGNSNYMYIILLDIVHFIFSASFWMVSISVSSSSLIFSSVISNLLISSRYSQSSLSVDSVFENSVTFIFTLKINTHLDVRRAPKK